MVEDICVFKNFIFLFRFKQKNTLFLLMNKFSEEIFCIANIAMFTRTFNIVQRLFSCAKLTLGDQRKQVLPMHFEQEVLIFVNKRLWNIKNVDSVVAKIG